MPRPNRIARMVAGLLLLALASAWAVTPLTHHHAASAPCEACKFLQATKAALPGGAPTPEREAATRRIESTATFVADASPLHLPLNRAPPAA